MCVHDTNNLRVTMAAVALAFAVSACTDPVRDDAVAALGPEPGPINEEHRPGTPCVVCHREGGPASSRPFSVAGTIYDTPASPAGADHVDVHLVSGDGSEFLTQTNRVGNFWVDKARWDPAFPLIVKIGKAGVGAKRMNTFIGREPSCAGCHFDLSPSSLLPDGGPRDYQPFVTVGRIYLRDQP